jgi:hypothetical protein
MKEYFPPPLSKNLRQYFTISQQTIKCETAADTANLHFYLRFSADQVQL